MTLGTLAGLVVSWAGVAVLVVLSIAWPGNQVPHVLLLVWLGAIICDLALPGGWPRGGLVTRIVFAPAGPLARLGFIVWRALRR
jgi:hypothetical protein